VIIDYFQFNQVDNKFVFDHYGHFLAIFICLPAAVSLGILSDYKLISFSAAALLTLCLGIKDRTVLDFDHQVILRQLWFVNTILRQSPPIALMDNSLFEIEEDNDPDSVSYWIRVYDLRKDKFVRLVYFSKLETAERIQDLIKSKTQEQIR
jgi:hypothetical protein